MDVAQITYWISFAVPTIVGIIAILRFIAELSNPKHTRLRTITRRFIIAGVFPGGMLVGVLICYWISLISPNHTFACITNTSMCAYVNLFYFWVAIIILGVFAVSCGALSSWGMWSLVRKYFP